MPIDYAALKSEIQTDPIALGYASHVASGDDAGVAILLGATQQTININVGVVPAYKVFEAIVPAEWSALSADDKQRIQSILAMGDVDTTGPNTRAAFTTAFPATTVTRTNLTALLTRKGSRAEQLFGAGTVVQHLDVAKALRG